MKKGVYSVVISPSQTPTHPSDVPEIIWGILVSYEKYSYRGVVFDWVNAVA